MLNWRVTITDNKGEEWPFVVAALGKVSAIVKARDFWKKQKTPGTTEAKINIQRT